MLVAWMIPDVPRSLREQLKKENMMLMEFLLNQDQEARVKSHSPKRSIPCLSTNIDIVVEAPAEEQEEQQMEEEEEEGAVEVNLDEPRMTSDSDPEVGKTFEEFENNGQIQREGEGEDDGGEVEKEEKERHGESNAGDGKGANGQEGGKEKEEGGQRSEEENEVRAYEKNYNVHLDSFMSELGPLGERINFMCHNISVVFS